jgi:hypothetical protein
LLGYQQKVAEVATVTVVKHQYKMAVQVVVEVIIQVIHQVLVEQEPAQVNGVKVIPEAELQIVQVL